MKFRKENLVLLQSLHFPRLFFIFFNFFKFHELLLEFFTLLLVRIKGFSQLFGMFVLLDNFFVFPFDFRHQNLVLHLPIRLLLQQVGIPLLHFYKVLLHLVDFFFRNFFPLPNLNFVVAILLLLPHQLHLQLREFLYQSVSVLLVHLNLLQQFAFSFNVLFDLLFKIGFR